MKFKFCGIISLSAHPYMRAVSCTGRSPLHGLFVVLDSFSCVFVSGKGIGGWPNKCVYAFFESVRASTRDVENVALTPHGS